MKFPFYLWFYIITSALLGGAGDYFSKKWTLSKSHWDLVWLYVNYNLGVLFWLLYFPKIGNLALAGKVWIIAATVILLMVSQLIFHEPITTKQWIGIWLGFVSLYLML